MVGRKSSMLLTAFCMAASNTHSRGRHSSSISFVDDAGKYLGETREHAERAQVDADERERGQMETRDKPTHTHTK